MGIQLRQSFEALLENETCRRRLKQFGVRGNQLMMKYRCWSRWCEVRPNPNGSGYHIYDTVKDTIMETVSTYSENKQSRLFARVIIRLTNYLSADNSSGSDNVIEVTRGSPEKFFIDLRKCLELKNAFEALFSIDIGRFVIHGTELLWEKRLDLIPLNDPVSICCKRIQQLLTKYLSTEDSSGSDSVIEVTRDSPKTPIIIEVTRDSPMTALKELIMS